MRADSRRLARVRRSERIPTTSTSRSPQQINRDDRFEENAAGNEENPPALLPGTERLAQSPVRLLIL